MNGSLEFGIIGVCGIFLLANFGFGDYWIWGFSIKNCLDVGIIGFEDFRNLRILGLCDMRIVSILLFVPINSDMDASRNE